MKTLTFWAYGTPKPQGSKNGYARGRKVVLVDSNAKTLKPWRKVVADAAREAAGDAPAWSPFEGPVVVAIRFFLPRPKSAPKTRTWPSQQRTGDIDKLVRAVLDSLTDAGVWKDDAQVTELVAKKDWCRGAGGPLCGMSEPGVLVSVSGIPDTAALLPDEL